VVARQLIEIHAEGRVHGDIAAPQIDIDKGCVFEGKCTMTGADPEAAIADRAQGRTAIRRLSGSSSRRGS
jgi:cytoskeletal protein CcmA (bactofilin family)